MDVTFAWISICWLKNEKYKSGYVLLKEITVSNEVLFYILLVYEAH